MANNLLSEGIELIGALRALLEEEPCTIATDEDCAFFRSFAKAKTLSHNEQKPIPKILPKRGEQCTAEPTESKIVAPSPPKTEMHSLFKAIAPNFSILEQIPDDREARLIAERWKMTKENRPILILFLEEQPAQTQFLRNVQEALTLAVAETSLIEVTDLEACNHWPTLLSAPQLRQILLCESLLKRLPHLLTLYRENPVTSARFLHKTPVTFLPDIALILQTPLTKRSLWHQLHDR